jgi:hypothetical protein
MSSATLMMIVLSVTLFLVDTYQLRFYVSSALVVFLLLMI